MAPKKDTSGEQFSFDVVACLLAALAESQVTIGAQHYKVMAKIDDSRTPSAYEHLFRPVKARAKEISEMIKKGELGDLKASPVKKTKENGVATGEKKGTKRGRLPLPWFPSAYLLSYRRTQSKGRDGRWQRR